MPMRFGNPNIQFPWEMVFPVPRTPPPPGMGQVAPWMKNIPLPSQDAMRGYRDWQVGPPVLRDNKANIPPGSPMDFRPWDTNPRFGPIPRGLIDQRPDLTPEIFNKPRERRKRVDQLFGGGQQASSQGLLDYQPQQGGLLQPVGDVVQFQKGLLGHLGTEGNRPRMGGAGGPRGGLLGSKWRDPRFVGQYEAQQGLRPGTLQPSPRPSATVTEHPAARAQRLPFNAGSGKAIKKKGKAFKQRSVEDMPYASIGTSKTADPVASRLRAEAKAGTFGKANQRRAKGDQSPRDATPLIGLKAWGKKQGWNEAKVNRASDIMWKQMREAKIEPNLNQMKMWMSLAHQKGLLD